MKSPMADSFTGKRSLLFGKRDKNKTKIKQTDRNSYHFDTGDLLLTLAEFDLRVGSLNESKTEAAISRNV